MTLDVAWLMLVMLASMRLAPMVLFAPGLGSISTPRTFRVGLLIAIALMVSWSLHPTAASVTPTGTQLVAMMAQELFLGAVLAFGMVAAAGAVLFAGRAIELQMGLGVSAAIDPSTNAPAPMLGNAMQLAMIGVFFATGAHHELVRAVAASFEVVPPGAAVPLARVAEAAVVGFSHLFALGLAVAGPTLAALLLADLVLVVMARSMPQLNVFLLSFAVKGLVGLSVLALSMVYVAPTMRRLVEAALLHARMLGG